MDIPRPPDGQERRDRNRLAFDLLKQANSHDEFFHALGSLVPNMDHFSNFPRRILTIPGYSIPMFNEWLALEADRRQTRERIDRLRGGIFPADVALSTQSNVEGLLYFCGAHMQYIRENMNPKVHENDMQGWKVVEDSHLASMGELGHGNMNDLMKFMDGLQKELEMRELAEKCNQKDELLKKTQGFATDDYLVGNEAVFVAYSRGDQEVREVLFKIAKHLVLERGFDFDEIW